MKNITKGDVKTIVRECMWSVYAREALSVHGHSLSKITAAMTSGQVMETVRYELWPDLIPVNGARSVKIEG